MNNKSVEEKVILNLDGPWEVSFDSTYGGPAKPVIFNDLQDWTKNSLDGIKYYSGTADYKNSFQFPREIILKSFSNIFLDLGIVKEMVRVKLNGCELGTVWTAPWKIKIPLRILKKGENKLELFVTNVWANRLIGDEQQPDDCQWLLGHQGGKFLREFPEWFLKNYQRPSKNRYCFTTWNYFKKDSHLVNSGLLGPVRVISNSPE